MNSDTPGSATSSGPHRKSTMVAWTLCVLVILFALGNTLIVMTNRPAGDNIFLVVSDLTQATALVVFAVTGALIISRQPRNAVGWLLMLEGTLAFSSPLDTYFKNLVMPPAQPSILFLVALWMMNWGWLWLIFPAVFVLLFFPTGRTPSRRWRWVIALGVGMCVSFMLFLAFQTPLGYGELLSVSNPIGFLSGDDFPMVPWLILLLSFVALCVASLFVRYRRAGAAEREQIKWLLYTAGVFFVIYAIGVWTSDQEGLISDLWSVALFLGILAFPVAIAVAILRYRLYDIDVIIRKTLVYAVLTVLLALVYFGSVVLLQQLFGKLTGVEQSPLAVVISTLIIAALFTSLRRRIQDWIDRRFFRKKYNAEQVLAAFALTARDETDLDALTAELVRVVQETMQPEHVSVWLKDSSL